MLRLSSNFQQLSSLSFFLAVSSIPTSAALISYEHHTGLWDPFSPSSLFDPLRSRRRRRAMSDALINGVAGAGGGIIAQLITYPLQTVIPTTTSLCFSRVLMLILFDLYTNVPIYGLRLDGSRSILVSRPIVIPRSLVARMAPSNRCTRSRTPPFLLVIFGLISWSLLFTLLWMQWMWRSSSTRGGNVCMVG